MLMEYKMPKGLKLTGKTDGTTQIDGKKLLV
jgi:hypothetical protein